MVSGSDDHLRVSDADRSRVNGLLERAVSEGMLTLDEFADRTDSVLAARTRGELRAVLSDLPAQQLGVPARPHLPPEQLRGWMTAIDRRGTWTPAPVLNLHTRMCSTTLDFTSAVLPGPVVEIVIDDYCSSTELIVPPGSTADVSAIDAMAGSATLKVRGTPRSDQLHVIVRGKVRLGSVTVRHPFGSWLRRLHGGR
ncbi:DUF1707 SHOCT-like domain-containing protein [Mycolicibacterium bacteremicum]|uniref:DUF1707 domain-containing protein n=1 Tax=Mycolicibacterium bacteremicum TaxID=564198 RepID=A0A1W9YW59_MYCBA|nr:DUF1707 domain-containing protein [Mycolicibacterium bacteremicum]MCV7430483.1 DUF1707 domain-containing protein [Mycolicibacterium bacteremicum]ORA04219.1 hypothetical protein BST17_15165 [Mycolicibacterium bacteremicum]